MHLLLHQKWKTPFLTSISKNEIKMKAPMIENDKLTVTIVPIREGTSLHRNGGKTRIL
jgi:hypothetical protein